MKPRVAVDTNVLVSGLLGGTAKKSSAAGEPEHLIWS